MKATRKLKIGSSATGDSYHPRQRLRNRLLRALQRDHVAFLGPRRTGKTSVLREIEKNPPDEFSAIYLDLQGLRDIPAWLNLMQRETHLVLQTPPEKLSWLKQAGGKVGSMLKRVEQITVLGQGIKLA